MTKTRRLELLTKIFQLQILYLGWIHDLRQEHKLLQCEPSAGAAATADRRGRRGHVCADGGGFDGGPGGVRGRDRQSDGAAPRPLLGDQGDRDNTRASHPGIDR